MGLFLQFFFSFPFFVLQKGLKNTKEKIKIAKRKGETQLITYSLLPCGAKKKSQKKKANL